MSALYARGQTVCASAHRIRCSRRAVGRFALYFAHWRKLCLWASITFKGSAGDFLRRGNARLFGVGQGVVMSTILRFAPWQKGLQAREFAVRTARNVCESFLSRDGQFMASRLRSELLANWRDM